MKCGGARSAGETLYETAPGCKRHLQPGQTLQIADVAIGFIVANETSAIELIALQLDRPTMSSTAPQTQANPALSQRR